MDFSKNNLIKKRLAFLDSPSKNKPSCKFSGSIENFYGTNFYGTKKSIFIGILTVKRFRGVKLPPKRFCSQNSYKIDFFERP